MARSQSILLDACTSRSLTKPVSDFVNYPFHCNLQVPAPYLLGSTDDTTALGWLVAPSGHTPAPKGPVGKSGHGTTFEASRPKVRTKSSKPVRTWRARFRAPIGRPLIGNDRGPDAARSSARRQGGMRRPPELSWWRPVTGRIAWSRQRSTVAAGSRALGRAEMRGG